MIEQQRPSPAVNALMRELGATIPMLTQTYQDVRGRLPRLQYKSGGTSHLIGIALDVVLHKRVPNHRILAHHLVALFVRYADQMRWSQIIYEQSNWVRRGNSVQYLIYTRDSRHDSHIHIDWWKTGAIEGNTINIPANANITGFAQTMRNDLLQVSNLWSNNQLTILDLPTDPLSMRLVQTVGSRMR
ncbi:MAG TPA: hypothetical protein PKE69_13070 [Pyrinomonadaceae bacterium]|nr:hypothetical protein [Pyrinomonadaceae bacterium]